jgi:hypothetical protein
MTNSIKTLLIILAFAVWGYFALTGKTSTDAFIQALRDALIGLGVFHAALTIPPRE